MLQPGAVIVGQGFVSLVGRHVRVAVLEHHEAVGRVGTDTLPDDVVVLGASELEKSQRRSCPGDAVPALGIAGHCPVIGNQRFSRLEQRRDRKGLAGVRASAIVHPITVVVLDHRDVVGGRTFPGLVEGQDALGGTGRVQLQLHPLHGVDQVVINEQFQARAYM